MNYREEANRIYAHTDTNEFVGEITFKKDKDKGSMLIDHTLVELEYRGRGIAEELVKNAIELAKREDLKIIPACSYVKHYFETHAIELKDMLYKG